MSFSQEVKRELCAVEIEQDCDALGECYGILLFANLFRQNGVRVITGNEEFARRVERLFFRAFGLQVEARRGAKEGRYVIEVTKHVPSQAGMGGGSADAAATLVAVLQAITNALTPSALKRSYTENVSCFTSSALLTP